MVKPSALSDGEQATPLLSLVIRVRNEAESLRLVFQALKAQRCQFPWEVVVVDNESEDDSRKVAEQMGARVISIPKAEFTYGRALNVGLRHARGELAVLMSAHSVPIGSCFLEKAVEPFSDPRLAAARCLSVQDQLALVAWHTPRTIEYPTAEVQKSAETGKAWASLYPTASCAVIRRQVWSKLPFDEEVESSEDKIWASKVLQLGYRLRCTCEAVYCYTKVYKGRDLYRKRCRHYLGIHRHNGWVPISLSAFVRTVLTSCFFAPWFGAKFAYERVVESWYLLMVPRLAKQKPPTGSLGEFDSDR